MHGEERMIVRKIKDGRMEPNKLELINTLVFLYLFFFPHQIKFNKRADNKEIYTPNFSPMYTKYTTKENHYPLIITKLHKISNENNQSLKKRTLIL